MDANKNLTHTERDWILIKATTKYHRLLEMWLALAVDGLRLLCLWTQVSLKKLLC